MSVIWVSMGLGLEVSPRAKSGTRPAGKRVQEGQEWPSHGQVVRAKRGCVITAGVGIEA